MSSLSKDLSLTTTSDFSAFKIGTLLIEMGKITVKDAEMIMSESMKRGERFGDVAKNNGFVTEADIQEALSKQFDYHSDIKRDTFSGDLVTAYQPYSTQTEVFRSIRSQLMLDWFKDGQKTLAITSVDKGNGGSLLAANLAVVFAQLGKKTLLVDGNLRTPTQDKIFKLKAKQGLSDMLVNRAGLDAISAILPFTKFSVLTAGTLPPNPQEIIGGNLFNELIAFLKEVYDIVIIDTPAFSIGAEAYTIGAMSGGALLVIRKDITKASDMSRIARLLVKNRTKLVGSVLTEF